MRDSIVIFDYGVGNLKSIVNAFNYIGVDATLTNDVKALETAPGVVIPGVGAFAEAKRLLDENGYFEPLQRYMQQDKPTLGICLGMQLLLSESEENGLCSGFNIIPGKVKKIAEPSVNFKLPHIGWKPIHLNEANKAQFDASMISHLQNQKQYFVHSYVAEPENNEHVLATVNYMDKKLVCAIEKGNVMGFQFHPEKSGAEGLQVLKKFHQRVVECAN